MAILSDIKTVVDDADKLVIEVGAGHDGDPMAVIPACTVGVTVDPLQKPLMGLVGGGGFVSTETDIFVRSFYAQFNLSN
jgi:hypothetical protein